MIERIGGKRRLFSQLAITLVVLSIIVSVPRVIGAAGTGGVEWLNPVDGATVSGVIGLEATGPSGTVKMGFFVDDNWLHVDTNGSPWTATLDASTLSTGTHVLKATARDANDKVLSRSTITVNVGSAPATSSTAQTATPDSSTTATYASTATVVWTTPTNAAQVTGTTNLEATGPTGTAKMSFFIDGGTWLSMDKDGAPWTAAFDSTKYPDGTHKLKATARDGNNTVLSTTTIEINIINSGSSPTPTPAPSPTSTASPTPSPTSTASPTSTPNGSSNTTGTGTAPSGSATIVRTVNGDDWTLPSNVTPSAHSAIYGYGATNDIMTTRTYMLTWADIQTGDNQFNWSDLDTQLSKGPVVLRIKSGTPNAVPAFIRNRHNWATFVGNDGQVELPQWSPGWVDEWKPFITALGARYRNDPRLVGLQLGITASGEPGMVKTDIANYERLGLTPTVLRDFLLRYQGDTLTSFQGAAWKIFTVIKPNFIGAYGGNFSKAQYAQAVRDGTLPLMAKGLGIRGSGMSEDYESAAAWSEWSEFVNSMVTTHDSTFQPLLTDGHIDGQLENWYGSNKSKKVTTSDQNKIRYAIRMSLLRALADQYSYLWIDAQDIDFLGGGLPHYVQLSLGKNPSDSPDALLVLGNFDGVNAWPRWLTPLNLGATGNGQIVDTSGLGFVSGNDYLGRTINSDLQLAIDDRVMSPTSQGTVQVAVTYLDNGGAWHLEYESANGIVSAPQIKGQGRGAWKTVTLSLPNAVFAGHLTNGADLRLVTDKGPVTVQVVRVIK